MFDDIIYMLEQEYDCHSFVLYGSHASQLTTPASDVDICAFRQGGEELRCCKKWNTHLLDVWIYPDRESDSELEKDATKFIRLRNGIVLKEKGGTGTRLIEIARKRFAEGPPAIQTWDLEVKKLWIEKTLLRIETKDPESNYRRAWLLYSLLENYFEFRSLWYLGPKESMTWLEQNDKNAFDSFAKALTPGASNQELQQLGHLVLNSELINKLRD